MDLSPGEKSTIHEAHRRPSEVDDLPKVPEAPEELDKTRKRRKHKSEGLEIVTDNGSCWATTKDFLQRTSAHAVCSQELKLDGEDKLSSEDWCITNGWKPFISPCCRTDKGECSAGVGIFVRKHLGATPLKGNGASQKLKHGSIVDGWAQAIHLETGLRGGLIICSVYLETGIGIGVETCNWQRLLRVGESLNYYGKPYVVAGGFNNSVAVLDASGWPSSIQGRIVAVASGQAGTCTSAQGQTLTSLSAPGSWQLRWCTSTLWQRRHPSRISRPA